MKRALASLVLIGSVGLSAAATAQSPAPSVGPLVEQDICLILIGPPVASADDLLARLTARTVTVSMAPCPLPPTASPEPSLEPLPSAEPTAAPTATPEPTAKPTTTQQPGEIWFGTSGHGVKISGHRSVFARGHRVYWSAYLSEPAGTTTVIEQLGRGTIRGSQRTVFSQKSNVPADADILASYLNPPGKGHYVLSLYRGGILLSRGEFQVR